MIDWICKNVDPEVRVALLLALGMLLLIFVLGYCVERAHADEWTPPDQPCTPTVSDFHHAYEVSGNIAAAVWWCDLPDGLHMRWISGTAPSGSSAAAQLLSGLAAVQLSGTDP